MQNGSDIQQETPACRLSDELCTWLAPDRREEGHPPRFSCRPFAARSTERNTTYGCFAGQIGLAGIPEFTEALQDLVKENPAKVIVDLARTALTKSVIAALVGFAASMHGHNKSLYLYQVSPQVRSVLIELKLKPFFHFLETEDDIIATLVL